jgi:hypothetical protein
MDTASLPQPRFCPAHGEISTMRVLKILALVLLLSTCPLAQSTTGGPLQFSGDLILGMAYDPYCPRSGVQADRATRVRLTITNPTESTVKIPELLGSFYDANGQALYLDRQAVEVKAGQSETIYLYYNNTARVIIGSVLVTASYESGGQPFQNQIAVTPAGEQR